MPDPKTTPAQKSIVLLEPHTHAGKLYPQNEKLTLDADLADWLISEKVAKADDAKAGRQSALDA
jgi:hypothetical protein